MHGTAVPPHRARLQRVASHVCPRATAAAAAPTQSVRVCVSQLYRRPPPPDFQPSIQTVGCHGISLRGAPERLLACTQHTADLHFDPQAGRSVADLMPRVLAAARQESCSLLLLGALLPTSPVPTFQLSFFRLTFVHPSR